MNDKNILRVVYFFVKSLQLVLFIDCDETKINCSSTDLSRNHYHSIFSLFDTKHWKYFWIDCFTSKGSKGRKFNLELRHGKANVVSKSKEQKFENDEDKFLQDQAWEKGLQKAVLADFWTWV